MMTWEELAARLKERLVAAPPTKRDREAQSLSFAYGNLAMSTNHKPCRNAFEKIAMEKYGWSKDEFDAWADTRTGWKDGSDQAPSTVHTK